MTWYLDRRVQIAAGAGVGWAILVAVLFSGGKPANPGSSSAEWLLLEGDQVTLEKGKRYRGCLVVPWFVPDNVVRGKLRPGIEARGFSDIDIAEDRPRSWPDVDCTFFVEATWDGDDEELERPSAVPFAWVAR